MSEKQTDWGDLVVRYPPEDVERYRSAGLWGNRTIAQEFFGRSRAPTPIAQRSLPPTRSLPTAS